MFIISQHYYRKLRNRVFTFILILRCWFLIFCGIFFVRRFHDGIYYTYDSLSMIVVLFWVGELYPFRRSWSGSLSLSVFAGDFATYLRVRGTESRRNFWSYFKLHINLTYKIPLVLSAICSFTKIVEERVFYILYEYEYDSGVVCAGVDGLKCNIII